MDVTADRLLWLTDISALSGPCVLAYVISLVGWPKHVKSCLSLSLSFSLSQRHNRQQLSSALYLFEDMVIGVAIMVVALNKVHMERETQTEEKIAGL